MAFSHPIDDIVKVSSTLELNGFEKLFCLHGNWLTVCHVAHLSGDSVSALSHERFASWHVAFIVVCP